ncbi:MAG: hypothetical protein PWP59_521, partial [Sphaerochaeta sp.]|nr:hypothetical protein [Sphaerochaeta sp.]
EIIWLTVMPPDMYGYAYIRVYSYVLLSILKFAHE